MMATKHITNEITVNLDESRMVESWGNADARVELWADRNNTHVWLETNGDPVVGQDEITEELIQLGVSPEIADRVINGDLSDFAEHPEEV